MSGGGANDLISVIIPAFNAAATIAETIESVQRQTYPSLEILVVDDGSADDTGAIVAEIARHDKRVRLIRQPNRGVAAARNHALSASQGRWIAPIDADDLWHPTKLARQMARLARADKEVGVVYCWSVDIDPEGIVIERRLDLDLYEGNVWPALVLSNFIGNSSVPLLRGSALETIGGWDESFVRNDASGCEDWALYLKLAETCNFALEPAFLVGYRQSPKSMSRDVRRMRRSFNRMMAELDTKSLPMARKIERWSRASFDVYCASLNWQSGNFLSATGFASLGIARDPQWLARRSTHRKIRARFITAVADCCPLPDRHLQREAGRLAMRRLACPFPLLNPDVDAPMSEGRSVASRRAILVEISKRQSRKI